MLLGLRVDGSAVVGDTNVNYALVEELLGVPLERGDRKGQSIKITWLKRNYNALNLTNESPEEQKLYKTRMYLLLLFACCLFPDTNGNTIHLQYLPLLEDLNEVSRYSWGAATLAHLYRNLCRCAMKNVHNFVGCGVLIQAWGWSRMPRLSPSNPNPYHFPYATKWSAYGMNYEKTPHHCAPGYWTFFDHFEEDDFIWRPYLELEDEDPTESDMWSSTTFIFSFTYVEMHHSDRVKLQFGIKQDIPGPPTCMEMYHKSTANDQWKFDNWRDHNIQEHQHWINCRRTVLRGNVMDTECKPSREYMRWYRSVTNLYLSQNRYLWDPRNQPTSSNIQNQPTPSNFHNIPSMTCNTQPPIFNTPQPIFNTPQQLFNTPFNPNPTQPPYTPSQHYNQPYTSFNPNPFNIQQQNPTLSYPQYNQFSFSQPTQQEHNYQTPQPQVPFYPSQNFTISQDQNPYTPYITNAPPPLNPPSWSNEGTRISYGSAAAIPNDDDFSDDLVASFMNPNNDAGPSTQPQNVEVDRRRSTRNVQAPACGTHQRLHRPGRN
ncbi:unnamed protein product [Lathyrus sativus]|nr:unnamed protein product [Lathyrus sativus]